LKLQDVQEGRFPSHFDFRFRHSEHAALVILLRRCRNGVCVFVDSCEARSGEAELLTIRSVSVRHWGRVMAALTVEVDPSVVHVS